MQIAPIAGIKIAGLRDHAGDEADEDSPEDAHGGPALLISKETCAADQGCATASGAGSASWSGRAVGSIGLEPIACERVVPFEALF